MKHILYILILLTCHHKSGAQNKLVDTVKEVTITERKLPVVTGSTQAIETDQLNYFRNNSMQQLLMLQSNIFIKNYGVGNLSTISIRGSSAAQTQVLWNGININNAMNGLSDFSSLPVSFFDQIDIQYGTDLKNAVIGGAVSLSHSNPFKQYGFHINTSLAYESLNNLSLATGINYARSHYANDLRINVSHAQNSYSFFNPEKNQDEKLTHALSRQVNIMNTFSVRFNMNNILSWHVWTQQLDRDIPAAYFEDKSEKHERNQSLRTLLSFEKQHFMDIKMNTTLGLFIEKYNYNDSLIFLHSNASVLSIPFNLLLSRKVFHHQQLSLQLIANHSSLRDQSDANILKGGALLSYSFDQLLNRFNVKASVQKEFTNVFQVPIIANLTLNAKCFKGLQSYASVSSNYRMPTLNELYYQPGGNLQLKPEHSKNIEAGIQYKPATKKNHIIADIALFHRNVNNWITWYGSSILTPHNIQMVKSRGLEIIANYDLDLSKRSTQLNSPHDTMEVYLIEAQVAKMRSANIQPSRHLIAGLFYAYTLSTTEESAIENDYSIGKQIPYVPRYQVKGTIGLKWNAFECNYIQTYTGYRFVTTDESEYLKPYFTGNLFFSYKWYVQNSRLQTTLKLNNLFNAHYESIAGRIMPGRNMGVGISWNWK